jgi:glycosyltransferase involved in cell wall biosynthesis
MHLIDSGGLYGAERMLLGLVQESMHQGIRATIVSIGDLGVAEKPLEQAAAAAGLPLIPLRIKNGLNLSGAREILALAKAKGADLLHSHGYKCNILMGLIPRRWRLPCVTTVHGYVHSPFATRMWCYEWLDRKMLSRLERVVLVSEQTLSHSRVRGLALDNVSVIANGLDCRTSVPAQSLPPPISTFIASAAPLLLAVGRLSQEKGFDTLVRAFAQILPAHADARLLIVGEGSERLLLERLIRELNLQDAVLLPGFSDQVSALLCRADLFLMPSLTEGLPMAMLEAMAADVPVIAAAVGGIPQLLEGGRCGKLVAAGEVDALAAAIAELLADPAEAAALAALARHRQQTAYSVKAMTDGYLALYRELLASKD